jgi:phospholipase C
MFRRIGLSSRHIRYGADWQYIVPNTQFFTDVESGKLPAVSWITPTCANSDHGGCKASGGPAWVASLVNAVGQSKYWKSTAIFVMWDEWSGWYDHVPPPYGQLAASDTRANDPAVDCFDFSAGPRRFQRFATNVPSAAYANALPELQPADAE